WLGALSTRELMQTSIWHSLDRELKRFFHSHYLREALGSYGMYLGGSPFDLPGIFSILPYGECAFCLWVPKGGIYGLVSGIEKLVRELGIKILTNHRVRRIAVEKARVVGIELANGDIHPFNQVVSNVDVPTTNSELIKTDKMAKTVMTPAVLTYYWGVRGKL